MKNLIVVIKVEGTIDVVTRKNDYNIEVIKLLSNLKTISNNSSCDNVLISFVTDQNDKGYFINICNQITPYIFPDKEINMGKQIYGDYSINGNFFKDKSLSEFRNVDEFKKIQAILKEYKGDKKLLFISNKVEDVDAINTSKKLQDSNIDAFSIILGTGGTIMFDSVIWSDENNISGLNKSLEFYISKFPPKLNKNKLEKELEQLKHNPSMEKGSSEYVRVHSYQSNKYKSDF